MPTPSGYRDSGTVISDPLLGAHAWASPSDAATLDTNCASCALDPDGESEYLWADNYNFAAASIPPSATIVGIAVVVTRRCSVGNCTDVETRLAFSGGLAGSDKADPGAWPATLSDANYGDSFDLWGLSPTVADIEHADFGAAIRVVESASSPAIADVDRISIEVWYTDASSESPQVFSAVSSAGRVSRVRASRVFADAILTDHVAIVVEHWPQTIYAHAARDVANRPQSRVFAPTEQAAPLAIVSMYDPSVVVIASRQRSPGRQGETQVYSPWLTESAGACDCPPAGAVLVGGGGFAVELVDVAGDGSTTPYRAAIVSTGVNLVAKLVAECDC